MTDYSAQIHLMDVHESTVIDFQVEPIDGEDHVFVHIDSLGGSFGEGIRVVLSDAPGPLLGWLRGIVRDLEEIDDRLRRKRIARPE